VEVCREALRGIALCAMFFRGRSLCEHGQVPELDRRSGTGRADTTQSVVPPRLLSVLGTAKRLKSVSRTLKATKGLSRFPPSLPLQHECLPSFSHHG